MRHGSRCHASSFTLGLITKTVVSGRSSIKLVIQSANEPNGAPGVSTDGDGRPLEWLETGRC